MATELESLVSQTSSFSSAMNAGATAAGTMAGAVTNLGKKAFDAINPFSRLKTVIGGLWDAKGMIGFAGIAGALQHAQGYMEQLEQHALQVTRSMGPMKDFAMWQGEIAKGAAQLGIEYGEYAQALVAANKYHAALSMSQKDFIAFAKDGARFGEMAGASAQEGAAAFGKLVGESKAGPAVIKSVQREMLALQNAIGLTGHEMLELINTGLTPIITQMKLLGETDATINRTVTAVGKLTNAFVAAGFEAGKAAGMVQDLLDPEKLTEHVMLFNQLGVSINDAISAMTGGGGQDALINRLKDQLPELAKRVAGMGIAGVQYAKSLGIPYRELLKYQNMSSEAAREAADKQEKERQEQNKFNEQWTQTMNTWKKWLISLSQAWDQVAMSIMDAFGIKNFKDIKELPIAFARVFADFLKTIKFSEIVKIAVDVIKLVLGGIQRFMAVVKPALDRLFSAERFQMISGAIDKLATNFGGLFVKILDKLPALIAGISKMIDFITPWVMKLVDFVAEHPGASVITLLLLKFGGFIMPLIGSLVSSVIMQFLPQLLKGAGNLLMGALRMAGRGVTSLGSGIMNFGGLAGTSASTAGGLGTVAGAATAAGVVGGIAGGVYGAYRLGSNIMDAKEQGHETGIAIKRGLMDTLSEPGAMAGVGAAIGTAIVPGLGTAIGAAIGAITGVAVDGARFAYDAYVDMSFSAKGMASSAEDLLAISNKLKESIEEIKDEKLKTALEDQNKFLEAQSETGFTWKKLGVGLAGGLIAGPIAVMMMNARADADARMRRAMVVQQGGFGALTDAQKAELLKKQGIVGFGTMQSTYLTAKGGVGYNMKAITDPKGAVDEVNKHMTGWWNSTFGLLPSRFGELGAGEQKKFSDSMNKVETQMFTPFADFRKNLMEQVSKGLINPEEAKAKLEESDKAIKALNLGLENQIKSIGMKAAGLDGVWSQIGASISDFSSSAVEWIKSGGPLGDKSFGDIMGEKGFQRQVVAQAITQLTQTLSADQLSALGRGGQGDFNRAVMGIINSNSVFRESYDTDPTKATSLINDAFTASMRGNLQLYGRGKKEQEENSRAMQQLLNQINTNTGRGAAAAEQTAQNTTPRKPVRMISLNEVAMRANESGSNILRF